MKKKIIALVGRPNVGKSTLFNRLSIDARALVHDKPGVTRDRKYTTAQIADLSFTIIDTPGLEESQEGKLEYSMMQQTIIAVKEADIVMFIVDGRSYLTPVDVFFANLVRRYAKNYLVIANKCESIKMLDSGLYKLGFGNPIAISAAHGIGMIDMYDAIKEKTVTSELVVSDEININDSLESNTIEIVVVGRPNAGKSTFINSIIGAERMLTGDMPGLTRESVAIDWQYKEQQMRLIDTAGLRRSKMVRMQLEGQSASDTMKSINFANTVILMLDAQTSLEQQDLKIASYVIEQGRSLVIAVNKWDLVKNKELYQKAFHEKLEHNLPQAQGVSVTFISALNKANIDLVLDECIKVYKLWNSKWTTAKLNSWLNLALNKHQPPMLNHGKKLKLKYITQVKTRPPTFKIFTNNIEQINDSYTKYLMNDLRRYCNLPGVPIRFLFTKSKNPYASKDKN